MHKQNPSDSSFEHSLNRYKQLPKRFSSPMRKGQKHREARHPLRFPKEGNHNARSVSHFPLKQLPIHQNRFYQDNSENESVPDGHLPEFSPFRCLKAGDLRVCHNSCVVFQIFFRKLTKNQSLGI